MSVLALLCWRVVFAALGLIWKDAKQYLALGRLSFDQLSQHQIVTTVNF